MNIIDKRDYILDHARAFIQLAIFTEKMLKFVLLVNKQGQTRLSQYYTYVPVEERVITEADIVRKCLSRSEEAVSTRYSARANDTGYALTPIFY